MPDIYESTYVVYFADKEHLPDDGGFTWSACASACSDDGRLVLTFEHTDRFEDLTEKAKVVGEIFASGVGNTVAHVAFVEIKVTAYIPERWPIGAGRFRVSAMAEQS